jgi:hypothetical protein
LSAIAGTSATEWARGTAACRRAHLADGAVADDLYREAIELFSCTRMATPLAWARLCYGEWLRHAKHKRAAEARTQLRQAFDAFDSMGTDALADRDRRELEGRGEQVRTHRQEPNAELTPQEHQIAQLARTRRTTPRSAPDCS